MRHRIIVILLLALFATAGCGGGGGSGDNSGGTGDNSGGGGNPPADQWTTLISRPWSLDAGIEGYRCRRIQIANDMYITGFRAVAPPGQHMMILTVSDSAPKIGDYTCGGADVDLNKGHAIFAAGIDTDDLLFPNGVGVHIKAGQYLNLNLHVVNSNGTSPLSGPSGVVVKTATAAEVTTDTEMIFSGTFNIGGIQGLPSDNQPHEAAGGCTTGTDMQVYAFWPAMRALGTRQKFSSAGVTRFDVPFDFNHQRLIVPPTPVQIPKFTQLQTRCTYVNNTGSNVTFGDGSNKEQCYTGIYRASLGSTSVIECVSQ